jgi:hypothetical protein
MPSLNFQKQFMPGILAMLDKEYARRKRIRPKATTIRAKRKRPFHKGDLLYLFSGQRTKHCQRLGKVTCRKTEDLVIKEDSPGIYKIIINGADLSDDEAHKIALSDGFTDLKEMIEWFRKTHGFPFVGQRIYLSNTYDRKYYLHKRVKDLEINIELRRGEKIIEVTVDQIEKMRNSKHIRELVTQYSYGIQIINPLFK